MPEAAVRRVLVALDTLSRSQAALHTAGALAAEFDAELAGLFVEDIDLARLFALPFARELCVLSGELRPLSPADIERGWRRDAAMLEQRLAEAAGALRLRWSFRVARGRRVVEASVQAQAVDLVVLAARAAALPETTRVPTAAAPVLVLAEPGRPDAGIDLGVRLARRSGTELVLLIPAADPAAFEAACQAGRAAAKGEARLRCVPLETADPAGLLRALRREAAGCLVLPDRNRLLEGGGYVRLLDAADCPVVLAG